MKPHLHFYRMLLMVAIGAVCINAQLKLGASTSLGPVWLLGGRVGLASRDRYKPQPFLDVSFNPVPERRMFRLNELEYLQLRERRVLVSAGITERLMSSRYPVGLDAELSLGFFSGWYRGSDRDFREEFTPIAAIGPVFGQGPARLSVRYQWFRMQSSNMHACSLVLEWSL